jgi:hypothetical protein
MDPASEVAAPPALSPRPADANRRAGARPVPEQSSEFGHLSLEALRAYRKTLTHEEDQVSYWRRIIQARLDVLRAGTSSGPSHIVDRQHLRPLLTDARMEGARKVLVEVGPVDDVPPLPNLAELWERRVDVEDEPAVAALDHDLDVAEKQLSAYRTALHRRIAEATGELIARYREQPTLCLSALPLGPDRPAVLT